MRRLNKIGQSVLEYVIIITAIVAGILAVAGTIKGHVETQVKHATGPEAGLQSVINAKFQ